MASRSNHRKLRRTMFSIPVGFVKELSPSDYSAFCLWLMIKTTYSRNSVLYHTSINQIAKRYKNSHYLTSKLVNRMIKNQWAEWTVNGHLKLHSFKRVCGYDMTEGQANLKIKHYNKLKYVKDSLWAALIHRKAAQQEYRYETSNDSSTEIPYKTLKKALKKYGVSEICEPKAITSDRSIAKNTFTTVSSAHRLKRRLVKRGIIDVQVIEEKIKTLGNEYVKPYYLEGKGLYKRKGNDLVLIRGSYITSYY